MVFKKCHAIQYKTNVILKSLNCLNFIFILHTICSTGREYHSQYGFLAGVRDPKLFRVSDGSGT